ncbi:MAG: UDP-glucose/GDP-mannose dehydrogenase family protein [Verrucomicrobia bacterium]|nr:UDP-glucose/GDP-mannose dehydrogenase family protein [Verrucomicrobiota bacterium]
MLFRILGLCLLSASAPLLSDNISVMGVGRLGLTYALCLEKAGHHVLGLDVSESYVDLLNEKTLVSNEPGIREMLEASQNFRATTSLQEALDFADIYFIVVNTATGEDGYQFDALTGLLKEINAQKVAHKHLVINSTLFPGYVRNTALPLLKDCTDVTLSYNPPFIAQGEIVAGLTRPDMVLIGEANSHVGDLIEGLYRSIHQNNPYIARMSVESAEIAKLALNCYVTAKVAFANLIGDIADETPGSDKYAILNAIGQDSRVGPKYLKPGYGFGGPCFVRDNRALADYADLLGIDPLSFRATDALNAQHAVYMAEQLVKQDLEEYIFEDVSYKPNCPVKILYASQKLEVARLVAEQGKNVTIIDEPSVIAEIQALHGDLFHYMAR